MRERLLRVVEGRGDGVALGLLEGSGVEASALDHQLQAQSSHTLPLAIPLV